MLLTLNEAWIATVPVPLKLTQAFADPLITLVIAVDSVSNSSAIVVVFTFPVLSVLI
jgi:hypothetical protein